MDMMNRREFIKSSAATSLVVGVSVPMAGHRALAADSNQVANHYFEITSDGKYFFTMDKSEMGQGVITGQATLFGEELDLDPSSFQIRSAPVDAVYGTVAGQQITGGSTSTKERWLVLRQAGADTRALLIKAAAKKWNIATSKISTDNGLLIEKEGSRKLKYADVISIAKTMKLDSPAKLKNNSDFKYIGKSSLNLDGRDKSTGQAVFGIDERLPNMLVGIVMRCPTFGGKLKSFDDSKVKQMPGVKAVFPISSGVAIVCEKYWQTLKTRDAISIEWNLGKNHNLSSSSIIESYGEKMEAESGSGIASEGNVDTEFSKSNRTVEAEFELPFLAHSAMEPMNAIAHVTEDHCEILSPNQAPTLIRNEAASILGLSREQVSVKTTKYLGGGFGRRSTLDYSIEAVEMSRQLKRPVKVVWSREDDTKHSPTRPINYHRLKAALSDDGILAWQHKLGCESILQQFVPRAMPHMLPSWVPGFLRRGLGSTAGSVMGTFGLAPTTGEGADPPYTIANKSVRNYTLDLDIPIHFWRSVGHSYNGFVIESFFDQCAVELNADPYQLRKKMLAKESRLHKVLDIVYHQSKFSQPGKRKLGLACHSSFDSFVAQVAEVEVDEKELTIKKIYCAVDCGTVINPEIVRAQMESGIIYGLSAALHGELILENGGYQQSNFDSYPPLRISETPEIEVFIVESELSPTGVGEPGLPPVAAAVANAIFRATGERLTKLPFRL